MDYKTWLIYSVLLEIVVAWRKGDGQLLCGGVLDVQPVQVDQIYGNNRGKIRIFNADSVVLKKTDFYRKYKKAMKQTIDYFQSFIGVAQTKEYLYIKEEPLCDMVDISTVEKVLSDSPSVENAKSQWLITDADLFLFVDVGCNHNCNSDCKNEKNWPKTAGFSGLCQVDKSRDRPTTGLIYLCKNGLNNTEHEQLVSILKHQIIHILGLNKIYLESMGLSLTERLDWKVSDKTYTSKNQKLTGDYLTKTRDAARKHFGCNTMLGVELEDSGFIKESRGVHWEKRLYWNEIMAPTISAKRMYLSDITASFLEEVRYKHADPPFYSVDRTPIGADIKEYWYGKKLGCIFAMESCYKYIEHAQRRYKSANTETYSSAFPYCTLENAVYSASYMRTQICLKEGLTKSIGCTIKKDLKIGENMTDPMGNEVEYSDYQNHYGYFNDLNHGKFANYHGQDPYTDFCPLFDISKLELDNLSTECGFFSCKRDFHISPMQCPNISSNKDSNKEAPTYSTYNNPRIGKKVLKASSSASTSKKRKPPKETKDEDSTPENGASFMQISVLVLPVCVIRLFIIW